AYIMGSNGPSGDGQLRYAVSDAERLARVLSSRRCGFNIAGPKTKAKALDIWPSLYDTIEQCDATDTFLCAFSGHAILDRGELFLLWDDTDLGKLLRTSLSATQLFAAMDRCKANSKLLILDCCHAGGILGKGFKGTGTPIADIAGADQNYLLLLASERLELARELEQEQGGFLTSAICKVLEDSTMAADYDSDGQISVDDLVLALRSTAQRHNDENTKTHVPMPILFGKKKSTV